MAIGTSPFRDVKILQLCLSPDLGGLELYVLRSLQSLRAAGKVVALATAPDSKLYRAAADSGVAHVSLHKTSVYLPLLAARRLARWLDDSDIEVIHIHWAKDLALASLAKRFARRKVKLVFTRHMDIFSTKKDFFHRWLYAPVDLFLTVTEAMREQAIRFLPIPPERVRTLYLGAPAIPASKLADCAALRSGMGIPTDSFLVGLVGRIEEPKGQHLLIDAIARLRREGKDIRAVLIGHAMDRGYDDMLRTRVKNEGLGIAVVFAGFQANPPAMMHCFEVVVLATRRETFGLVLIEAMNAGTAVIGSDAGGVREIIVDGETGLRFESGNAAALANALRRLYDDPALRQRLAAAGKQRANNLFNETKHYRTLIELYRETVASRA